MAQEDVLGNREVRKQPRLLVDDGDPELARTRWSGDLDSGAVKRDLAGVGLVDAGQDLDEGALAGAVFADEGVDLGRQQRQGNAVQRLGGAEALRDAHQLGRRPPPTVLRFHDEDSE